MSTVPPILTGRHVAFLSWRDTTNPEGGGAERYLEEVAEGLVARGATVTVFSARHADAPGTAVRNGVRYVYGGSKLSVYLHGMLALLRGRLGRPDVVIDVQNGMPFFTRLVTRRPVIVLVHHIHREQWPIVYPGTAGRVGWWIERWLSPRLYRRARYVAVSHATKAELVALGVDEHRIAVVHNGNDGPRPNVHPKTDHPSVCVVCRLVPHKQVEHAIDAVNQLREEFPDLELTIVGSGWWQAELEAYAARTGAPAVFAGFVSETVKREIYERSWVMALPSLKEGWGLVVGEAALAGTPTVAYRSAGGTQESIEHDYSGLLADTREGFVEALRVVLAEHDTRRRLAKGAQDVSSRFSWEHARASFAEAVRTAVDQGHP
jgi:glycosyltransferase involved in cell wall biosynthesis